MKVTLINCTEMGNPRKAAELLIFAKSTRLQMKPSLMEELGRWSETKVLTELEAIASTIPSCWEFLDYTFLIEDVTRAFTHQFVRTRHASFAQQTMRVLNVAGERGWSYGVGPSIETHEHNDAAMVYHETMTTIGNAYKRLIAEGVAIEDARGVLPTNIHTNILVKMNLRTLVETVRKRSSPRVQGEYQAVLGQMKEAAIMEQPWLQLFLTRTEDVLRSKLYEAIDRLAAVGTDTERLKAIKLVDELFGSK